MLFTRINEIDAFSVCSLNGTQIEQAILSILFVLIISFLLKHVLEFTK